MKNGITSEGDDRGRYVEYDYHVGVEWYLVGDIRGIQFFGAQVLGVELQTS